MRSKSLGFRIWALNFDGSTGSLISAQILGFHHMDFKISTGSSIRLNGLTGRSHMSINCWINEFEFGPLDPIRCIKNRATRWVWQGRAREVQVGFDYGDANQVCRLDRLDARSLLVSLSAAGVHRRRGYRLKQWPSVPTEAQVNFNRFHCIFFNHLVIWDHTEVCRRMGASISPSRRIWT